MRVWVTRDEDDAGPLSMALRGEGLQPIVEPVVRRRKIDDAGEPLRELGADDWLVVTSAFAVECLAADLARVPRVAAIGAATADAARRRGMRVELVAQTPTVQSLFAELLPRVEKHRTTVCYPRSSVAAATPPMPAPVRVLSPVVYETSPVGFDRGIVDRVDCMAVTSASAVRAIGATKLRAASIGRATSRALRDMGMCPWLESPRATFDALARAIADQARDSRNHRA
jgi:uroporphyrinogen-III synthase